MANIHVRCLQCFLSIYFKSKRKSVCKHFGFDFKIKKPHKHNNLNLKKQLKTDDDSCGTKLEQGRPSNTPQLGPINEETLYLCIKYDMFLLKHQGRVCSSPFFWHTGIM